MARAPARLKEAARGSQSKSSASPLGKRALLVELEDPYEESGGKEPTQSCMLKIPGGATEGMSRWNQRLFQSS